MNYQYNSRLRLVWTILIAVLLVGGGFLIWFLFGDEISNKIGDKISDTSSNKTSGETISCSKKNDMLEQTIAVTYRQETPTKLEFNYKFHKDKIPEDGDLHLSFSSEDGLKSDPDEAEVFEAMMIASTFAQYDGKSGVKYTDDDGSKTRTVSFVADLTKADTAEFRDDTPTKAEFKQEYTSNGFTCKNK